MSMITNSNSFGDCLVMIDDVVASPHVDQQLYKDCFQLLRAVETMRRSCSYLSQYNEILSAAPAPDSEEGVKLLKLRNDFYGEIFNLKSIIDGVSTHAAVS